jgi:hypothetical protein
MDFAKQYKDKPSVKSPTTAETQRYVTQEVVKMHAGLKVAAEMLTVLLGATTVSAGAIEDTQAIPTRHVTHVSTRTTAFAMFN